jgi:mono/diheme cytochrome c family protein
VLFLASLAACKQQMAEQPRYEPLGKSDFFIDGRSARQPVEGTVARGELRDDEQFYTGNIGGKPAETFPFPISAEILQRGRQRFDIFCSPCHDRVGNGQGMVVRRGFRAPPSLHIDRLRQAPPGHLFEVMTRGFGTMPSYAEQISAADRWAIAAYIRALQFSQQARLADVPEKERRRLEANP